MSEPIRILQVFGIMDYGGAESMIMSLYRHIDRTKIQFDFIVHTKEVGAFDNEIHSLGGTIFHFPRFKGKNICTVLKCWNKFFVEHPNYRIMHSHVRSYASLYLYIAKRAGLKVIIHSHSTSNGKGLLAFVKGLLQYPLRFQADYLMSCSRKAGEWLYGSRKCNENNFILLPNSIELSKYKYNEEVSKRLRSKLNIENCFVYGHVGRFHEAKNHIFMIELFKRISVYKEDAVLLLIGDGRLKKQIVDIVEKENLQNKVIFTGTRRDVPDLMQVMDAFIFPSLWEGLPVTVIEAQASGLQCFISKNITSEVEITPLVHRIDITNIEQCVKELLLCKGERTFYFDEIKLAGYDVEESAKTLSKLYMKMLS